jgi:mannose-6-phosphate isomerase-like protein (cupin superfamily)
VIEQVGYGQVKDLVAGATTPPYLFREHTLEPGRRTPIRRHAADHRTFVVIQGEVALEVKGPDGRVSAHRIGHLQGWHALPTSTYRIANPGDGPAAVVEGGSALGETRESDGPEPAAGDPCPSAADYTVGKPWGHEVWYTQNLPGLPYALKQIHMTAGHQSSLQSHEHKRETNYVVEGEATVLDGLAAPRDLGATVDVARLRTSVHGPRSGWTSQRRELHRVIARTDYTSIEISTPELDDVIRWQDDTGRAHGRIAAEHAEAGRS